MCSVDTMITNAGSNVTRQSGTGKHAMELADVANVMGFVGATIDPLAPKVHCHGRCRPLWS